MLNKKQVKTLLLQTFREEALVIGGLSAMRSFDDEHVWRVMRQFNVLLRKTFAALDIATGAPEVYPRSGIKTHPHPAIEGFLAELNRLEALSNA